MPLVGGKFFPRTRKGIKAAYAYRRRLRARSNSPSSRKRRTYKIRRDHIPSQYGAGKSVDAVAATKVRQRRIRAKARIRYYAEQIKVQKRRKMARMTLSGRKIPSGRRGRDLGA